jgi:hypothetical protein
MQHPIHYAYTQSQHTRPKDARSKTPSHPKPSHFEFPPHPKTQKPRHTKPNTTTATTDVLNKQRHHSLPSLSEEAETTQQASKNDWQIIRRKKGKKPYSSQPANQIPQIQTQNRYDILIQEVHHAGLGEKLQQPKNHKHPPIFIMA